MLVAQNILFRAPQDFQGFSQRNLVSYIKFGCKLLQNITLYIYFCSLDFKRSFYGENKFKT